MNGQKGTRAKVGHPEGGKVLVKQGMRDEVDANRIMEKWIHQGHYPRGARGEPMYGDFGTGLDYHGAMNRVIAAQTEFGALPSRVRTRCRNDPGVFLELCSDPEALEELRELGLAERDVPDQVVKVEVINEREGEGAGGAAVSQGSGKSSGSGDDGRPASTGAPKGASKGR